MLTFTRRILQCGVALVLTPCLPAAQRFALDAPHLSRDESANLRATIKSVDLGSWRLNGFEVVDVSNARETPWHPFLTPTKGYVAIFSNPAKDIANMGKGGSSQGKRHPEFSLWIFPITANNTPEHFEETIRAHQMVQSSIPSVLGASKDYVVTCVGDADEAGPEIIRLAKALRVNRKGAR